MPVPFPGIDPDLDALVDAAPALQQRFAKVRETLLKEAECRNAWRTRLLGRALVAGWLPIRMADIKQIVQGLPTTERLLFDPVLLRVDSWVGVEMADGQPAIKGAPLYYALPPERPPLLPPIDSAASASKSGSGNSGGASGGHDPYDVEALLAETRAEKEWSRFVAELGEEEGWGRRQECRAALLGEYFTRDAMSWFTPEKRSDLIVFFRRSDQASALFNPELLAADGWGQP